MKLGITPAVAGLAPSLERDVRGSRNTTAQESNVVLSDGGRESEIKGIEYEKEIDSKK